MQNRPYIICHMTMSIDGKVTEDFLTDKAGGPACDIYYDINRTTESNGFICGRVTMESSFTGGYYPDLSQYQPKQHELSVKADYITDDLGGYYAIAFDPKGKLGWKSDRIIDADGDPGYNGAQIIEVLTAQADDRYLSYLESMEIPYILAGEKEIDVELALFKLKNIIGCEKLMLEGGSVVNGYFERADLIDELSLVVAPCVGGKSGKPLFADSTPLDFELVSSENINGNMVMRYKRKKG